MTEEGKKEFKEEIYDIEVDYNDAVSIVCKCCVNHSMPGDSAPTDLIKTVFSEIRDARAAYR